MRKLYSGFKPLGCKLSIMSFAKTALHAFSFLLDSDVKLSIPDSNVYQMNLETANEEASADIMEL